LPKYRKISNVSEGAVERKEVRYPHGRRRKRKEAEEEWGSAAGTVSFRARAISMKRFWMPTRKRAREEEEAARGGETARERTRHRARRVRVSRVLLFSAKSPRASACDRCGRRVRARAELDRTRLTPVVSTDNGKAE
jgi:hypothetical protein